MYYALVSNALDVLALSGIVIWVDLSLGKKYSQYILGVVFGLITIFVIQGHITVDGRFFDFRNIILTLAGFIGGPVTAVIAALISSLYRYNVGGSGSMGGIAGIIIFACFGSILGRHLKINQNGKKLFLWFMIGIVMVCIYLFIIVLISPSMRGSVTILRTVSGPFLIITPLATTIIFNFYFRAYDFFSDVTVRKSEQEKLRVANERFSKAFHLAPHMMAILRKSDNKYIDVNRRYLEARGFAREDVIGETPISVGAPENGFIEMIKILEEQGSVQNIECPFVTKYGSQGTAVLSAQEIQIDDQECVLLAYNDITELKRLQTERIEQLTRNLKLEADLSRSNQLIADIMTNMQDAFYVLDNQWRFTFVNNKAEKLLKKTREELLGKVLWEINPLTRDCLCGPNFQKAWDDCKPITFEVRCVLNKGIWNQVTAYPTQFGLSVYYRDITERKLASEKLTKSQEEMASILESMTDCFIAIDENWQLTYINHAGEQTFGKSRDELLNKNIAETHKVYDTALQSFHEVMNEKRSVTFEKDLGHKWFEISAYPAKNNGMICYFRDITIRKQSEETLRQSEEKFSKAFHGGPIMMVLATVEDGEFTETNEAFCSATGYTREELIGHTTKELNFFADTVKRQARGKLLTEQGKIENVELDFRTKSGEIRHALSWSQLFYSDGKPCHITGLIDVTEQKHIQKEMAKIDRLNLVGQLAAGIAHEVRNPMTTVRGYLQLLGEKPEFASRKPTFALMISEMDRANLIITEFLSLAQTKQTELKTQALNDIVSHLYPLLEADTFTQNKQICFIPGEIPNLKLNRKEISQLVLNLTRNGLESMAIDGSLTIKSYLQDGQVVLEFTDEGCGIPPENLIKLGTPFFTTKDTGTGLGLASCYKIAEAHNAKVRVNSGPSGTTFSILFPILENYSRVPSCILKIPSTLLVVN